MTVIRSPISPVIFSPLRAPTALYKGGEYEAEAVALFARFTTPPTATRKGIINTLIKALKDGGIWTKLDAFYVMAAADAQAAQRNWVADQFNLTLINTPTFTTDRGYAGNGSNSGLNTNFNPGTASSPKYVQNSAHASITNRTSRAGADLLQAGAAVGSNFSVGMATRSSANTAAFRANMTSSNSVSGANTENAGRYIVSRTGATASALYKNGTSIGTSSISSVAPPNAAIYLGGYNSAGTLFLPSSDQLAHFGVGAGLDATEAAALDAALSTYLTAVGA